MQMGSCHSTSFKLQLRQPTRAAQMPLQQESIWHLSARQVILLLCACLLCSRATKSLHRTWYLTPLDIRMRHRKAGHCSDVVSDAHSLSSSHPRSSIPSRSFFGKLVVAVHVFSFCWPTFHVCQKIECSGLNSWHSVHKQVQGACHTASFLSWVEW